MKTNHMEKTTRIRNLRISKFHILISYVVDEARRFRQSLVGVRWPVAELKVG